MMIFCHKYSENDGEIIDKVWQIVSIGNFPLRIDGNKSVLKLYSRNVKLHNPF